MNAMKNIILLITAIILISGCKKLIEPTRPNTQILGPETYKDSSSLQQNLAGMYIQFISYGSVYATPVGTYPGLSADELLYFGNGNTTYNGLTNDAIPVDDGNINSLWNNNYAIIYVTNDIIAGIANSGPNAVSPGFKNQATAEAKFIRALCYFYLTNYFGDVPLLTTTDVGTNASAPRTPAEKVYSQIIEDLQFAEDNLADTYALTGNERTRATKWTAKALLARVYLYRQQWEEAEKEASAVIANPLFSLPDDLNQVFSPSSQEAILQFYNDLNGYTAYAADVLPNPVSQVPVFYLTPQLLNSFEAGDERKTAWTGSLTYNGTDYTYPYKYKSLSSGSNAEYYTVLRLAEQYLIRAEARAHLNNLAAAKSDVDVIRKRAGLEETTASLQTELLAAIAQENRIEFNNEWGHRWFDLKRTNTADAILGALKPATWKPTAILYPIPLNQIRLNNNLKQNDGYK